MKINNTSQYQPLLLLAVGQPLVPNFEKGGGGRSGKKMSVWGVFTDDTTMYVYNQSLEKELKLLEQNTEFGLKTTT